jgi:glycosyltransferase A (GT-A) superfamily protein (DUF2064 family)
VIVLCRDPHSPCSKTRLAAEIGRPRAREAYALCLRSVLRTVGAVGCHVRLAVADDAQTLQPLVRAILPECEVMQHTASSFAAVQVTVVARALAEGFGPAVFVASDLIGLRTASVEWTIDTARQGAMAVVASPDHGYAMLGTTRPIPELRTVRMSTDNTLSDLITAAANAGKRIVVHTEVIPDLDHKQDLLAATGCSSVAAALRSLRARVGK